MSTFNPNQNSYQDNVIFNEEWLEICYNSKVGQRKDWSQIYEVLEKQWSACMLTVISYGNNLMSTFLKILQSEYEAHKNSKLIHIHLTGLFLCIIFTHKNSNYNNCQVQQQNLYPVGIYKFPLKESVFVFIIFIQNFTCTVH